MSFKLPENIVDRLLELLGQNDEFRAGFLLNPRRALAQLGYAPAADQEVGAGIWFCFPNKGLASKETIRATRAALRHQLVEAEATFNPIGLGWSGSGRFHAETEQAEHSVAELINH